MTKVSTPLSMGLLFLGGFILGEQYAAKKEPVYDHVDSQCQEKTAQTNIGTLDPFGGMTYVPVSISISQETVKNGMTNASEVMDALKADKTIAACSAIIADRSSEVMSRKAEYNFTTPPNMQKQSLEVAKEHI